ncbi:hypothetical protein HH213_17120 [Duganella dendranthematis]|uniref:Restriction endonuclease type IV Mrr domain-containing protein n=1 Tax=Duganella dendranthematis TaxID=2728021 RepID=A0ABX6MBQ7_9BURK|nr:restriction endonuclease [Duganella dendranthematis]QJD91655.1 hypothetical protein HH213_17120 [Duganella dendranthematis]
MKYRSKGKALSAEVMAALLDGDDETLPGDVLMHEEDVLKMRRLLKPFHLRTALELSAALLTLPQLQASTPRIECLIHLVASSCAGKRKATDQDIARWLNRNLHGTPAWRMEDPAEDVFVGNVSTQTGNFRILQDAYPYNDCYLSTVLNSAFFLARGVQELNAPLKSVLALLKLSEQTCKRLGLKRWSLEDSESHSDILVGKSAELVERGRTLQFNVDGLREIGIDINDLEPFLLGACAIDDSSPGTINRIDSPLRDRPLVKFGDVILLALPNAVASASKRFLIRHIEHLGLGRKVSDSIAESQLNQVLNCFSRLGVEIKHDDKQFPEMENAISFDFVYEPRHVVHLLVLLDDADVSMSEGDYSTGDYTKAQLTALRSRIEERRVELELRSGFDRGTLVVVFGGIGRQRVLALPPEKPNWDTISFDVPDIDLLLNFGTEEFRKLLKCQQQARWLRETGVNVYNPSGAFGQYCYWTASDYKIVPHWIPLRDSGPIPLLGNFLAVVRQRFRDLSDEHVVTNRDGKFLPVARFGRDSFFQSHIKAPLYASPLAAENGYLAAAAKSANGYRWLIVKIDGLPPSTRRTAYEIWSNFANKFFELAVVLDSLSSTGHAPTLEVHVDVSRVNEMEQTGMGSYTSSPFDATIRPISNGGALIRLPPNFFDGFMRIDNAAERSFLLKVGAALVAASHTIGITLLPGIASKACDEVLPLGGGRLIHIFPSRLAIDNILNRVEEIPSFVDDADVNFVRIGLVRGFSIDKPKRVKGKDNCIRLLNGIVDSLWGRIRTFLKSIERTSLLTEGFRSIEALHAENSQWRNSAQAVLALHGADAISSAFKRDQDRSRTSLATRILLEMAICECPVQDGGVLALSEYESLLALISVLVEVAYDSDAIHGELAEAELVVYPNGEYHLDRRYRKTIMAPFVSNQFASEFQDAAVEYEAKVTPREISDKDLESPYSAEFSKSFAAEYKLTPDELLLCCSELIDLAVVKDSAVVVSTWAEIKKRFTENRGLSEAVCDAFVQTFCLVSRQKWDKAPPPFKFRDIAPWLFRRRLSIMIRPVLMDGLDSDSRVIYGASQLSHSWNYFVSRSEVGRFSNDFFESEEMRLYVGRMVNKQGADFENQVADVLRSEGWKAITRIQLTALGGTQAQGDLDVLAWKPCGRVLAIECKWLQQARTVKEVAEVLAKFAGEERDNLQKHCARMVWLKANPRELLRLTDITECNLRLLGLLVTDRDVPMMYVNDLPIPATDVVPLRALTARLKS